MDLTSKQRSQLRGMANDLDTIVHIGKDGIGPNLTKQAEDALEARELIKVVQVIGTKFVLYRETHSRPKEKRIKLVK